MDESPAPVLPDHVVFYAGTDLPALCRQFESLGFYLTPLGRHSSGSINRLAILEGAYIELIGFEAGVSPDVRPDLQAQSLGLNALAFSNVAGAARDPRDAAQFNPPVQMERPVTSGAESAVVRFRITTLKQGLKDFRVFLCDHLTPEWVWRPEWQKHANAAYRVASVRVSTPEADRLRSSLRLVMGLPPDHAGTMSCGGCSIDVVPATAGSSRLGVFTTDLAAAKAALQQAGLAWRSDENEPARLSVVLPAPASCEIVFIEQARTPSR